MVKKIITFIVAVIIIITLFATSSNVGLGIFGTLFAAFVVGAIAMALITSDD